MNWQKRIRAICVVVLAATGLTLTSCNTVDGAGQDLEATGDAIQDAAD